MHKSPVTCSVNLRCAAVFRPNSGGEPRSAGAGWARPRLHPKGKGRPMSAADDRRNDAGRLRSMSAACIVGGGAPVVVQSMTNTDTADVDGDGRAGGGAGARRLRDRAHHGRPRRGGGRRAAHQGAAAQDGRRRADRRRLPLYRPQAARRSSGLRRGARQVPHQSRQCRLQGQEGPPVLRHRRDRDQARQAGAHRRQLGLARPGAAHPPDGRERALDRRRRTRAR